MLESIITFIDEIDYLYYFWKADILHILPLVLVGLYLYCIGKYVKVDNKKGTKKEKWNVKRTLIIVLTFVILIIGCFSCKHYEQKEILSKLDGKKALSLSDNTLLVYVGDEHMTCVCADINTNRLPQYYYEHSGLIQVKDNKVLIGVDEEK